MKWDNLTMSQKQALMKIYVNNGITNLDEIRNHYNRFDDGGPEDKLLHLKNSTEDAPIYDKNYNPLLRSNLLLNRENLNTLIKDTKEGSDIYVLDSGDVVGYKNSEANIPKDHSKISIDDIKAVRKGLDYIGGSKTDAHLKYYEKVPNLVNMIDSLSNVYGVNKDIMLQRLAKEGFVNNHINEYNNSYSEQDQRSINDYVLDRETDAFYELGLDRAGEHLAKGHYKLKWKDENLGYSDRTAFNEKGEMVHTIHVPNLASGLEIKAAHLEYLTNMMKERYPKASRKQIDTMVNAAYNIGEYHKDLNNLDWINNNYEVLPWSEILKERKTKKNKK